MEFLEFTGKTVDDALTEALVKLGTTSDKIEYEVIDKGSAGFLGFNSKPARIRARKKYSMEENVREFLQGVFQCMNMQVEIEMAYSEEEASLNIELKGDDMGVLIGKRGQTLDSLQYLTSLVANKQSDSYIRVKLDTEDYRQRRRSTLENLAKNIAFKVKKTHKPVVLEPMNPYERRIIHSALQNDKYVYTHSEGEEPYRKVVVSLKNEYKEEKKPGRRGNYSRGGYSRGYGGKGYKRDSYREDRKESFEKNEDDVQADQERSENE